MSPKKVSPGLLNFYTNASLEAIEHQPHPFAKESLVNSPGVSSNYYGLVGTFGGDVIVGDGAGRGVEGREGDDLLFSKQSAYISGGQGVDVMVGDNADTWYEVDNPGDRVIEFVNGGVDGVRAQTSFKDLTYTLPKNVELGIASGYWASVTLVGNELDNTMYAGSTRGVANVYGMEGDDHLFAGTDIGTSTLDGGQGNDILQTYGTSQTFMTGGEGLDQFLIDTSPQAFAPLQINDFSDRDDSIAVS